MKGAILLLLASATAQAFPPSQLVSRGNPGVRTVALTFDAGSDRGYGLMILQTLERNHVHAAFGMTGRWAEQSPDLVRRMARDGDTFINHTYDHRSFTGLSTHSGPLSAAQRGWELWKTEQIIFRLTGRSTKPYFRPPYGDYDAATLTQVQRLGYRFSIMWTVDTLGWEGLSSTAILQRAANLLVPGAIYLMHVGIQSRDALALPALLALLHRQHYRVVTLPQMLAGH